MKLITLNIWGGHVHKPLLEFLENNKEVDFFCFQEVFHNAQHQHAQFEIKSTLNIYTDIKNILTNHISFFRPAVGDHYGLAMFVKKGIKIIEEKETLINENKNYSGTGGNHSKNAQWVIFEKEGQEYAVINLHGLWNGKGKTDAPERIEQSKKIKALSNSISVPKIICGDFNLNPETESLKIVKEGMRDLVKQYGVISTRTSFYSKPEKFADYIFTSPEIVVKNFKVLTDEVSDHSPLLLEF